MELAKAKSKRRDEMANSQSIRRRKSFNFDLSSCLGDDVAQNVSETDAVTRLSRHILHMLKQTQLPRLRLHK